MRHVPKKTLSAASLLSECERKRCRSLEARGCAKSESEFSMGTAATCPFIMSEQSPRTIKPFQSVCARSNKPALRQTEIHTFMRLIALNSAITEADITSVSIPAPQVIVPSGAVTPMYAMAREVEPISRACSL